MDNLLTLETFHQAVVVYHQWWMGVAFWTCVGVGILGAVLFALGFGVTVAWAYKSHEDIAPTELLIPGAFLLMIDVPLWAIYGALRLFGFQ